jgi:hypothetical protein
VKVVNVTFDQIQAKLAEFKLFGVPYKIIKAPLVISLKTKNFTYKLSLIKDKVKSTDPRIISKEFKKKTNYHYIENQYGYKYKIMKDKSKTRILWDYKTACGYSYANKHYAKTWLNCWSYDINSAFSYAMLRPMPDTTKKPKYEDFVGPNEIGFYKTGEATTRIGDWADIIFPLMDSPFKQYVLEYYQKKEIAIDKDVRQMWKDYLNIPTGCIQRHNIFLRNAIIHYSNEYIKKYIDENTIYCNVDCIVSLVPRPDIPTGDCIGSFKNEHNNEAFKFIDTGMYQWNDECHYKGIPSNTIIDIEHTENWFVTCLSNRLYDYDEKLGEFVKCQNVEENQ